MSFDWLDKNVGCAGMPGELHLPKELADDLERFREKKEYSKRAESRRSRVCSVLSTCACLVGFGIFWYNKNPHPAEFVLGLIFSFLLSVVFFFFSYLMGEILFESAEEKEYSHFRSETWSKWSRYLNALEKAASLFQEKPDPITKWEAGVCKTKARNILTKLAQKIAHGQDLASDSPVGEDPEDKKRFRELYSVFETLGFVNGGYGQFFPKPKVHSSAS